MLVTNITQGGSGRIVRTINWERKGHTITAIFKEWWDVKEYLRSPNYTSVNIYYDNEEQHWSLSVVLDIEDRDSYPTPS